MKHARTNLTRPIQAVLMLVCAASFGWARAQDASSGPQVNSVDPSSVTPGSQINVKVKGKGFADGARAAFSNPAIHVLATKVKSSELTVEIQVAASAATGSGSLFVINPDDNEVEAHFDVAAGNPVVTATTPAPSAAPATGSAGSASPAKNSASAAKGSQDFEVYNLGNVASILGAGSETKGTLSLAAGKLKYAEGGQQVFSAGRKDVKEIGINSFLGVSTPTFHIILSSGKTYNFAATSFRASDSQSIVDSLRQGLR